MRKTRIFVVILCLLFFVSSLEANDLAKEISGKWKPEGGVVWEFFEDGTMLASDGADGTYKIFSNGRIKWTLNAPLLGNMTQVFHISISGDIMKWISNDGQSLTFKRIR